MSCDHSNPIGQATFQQSIGLVDGSYHMVHRSPVAAQRGTRWKSALCCDVVKNPAGISLCVTGCQDAGVSEASPPT